MNGLDSPTAGHHITCPPSKGSVPHKTVNAISGRTEVRGTVSVTANAVTLGMPAFRTDISGGSNTLVISPGQSSAFAGMVAILSGDSGVVGMTRADSGVAGMTRAGSGVAGMM